MTTTLPRTRGDLHAPPLGVGSRKEKVMLAKLRRRGRAMRAFLALALVAGLIVVTPAVGTSTHAPLTPFNMEVVGHSGGIFSSITAIGDHLLVTRGNSLVSYDVSGGTLAEAGAAALPGVGGPLFVEGARAYVVGENSFAILDVTDPAAPAFLGSANMPSQDYAIEGFFAAGDYAYVGYEKLGAHAMKVFDVSDPISPTIANYCDAPIQGLGAVVGDVVYSANPAGGLSVIDISSAGSADVATTLTYADPVDSVVVVVDSLYVATHDWDTDSGDLITYSLGTPLAPALEDTQASAVFQLSAAGNRLWGVDSTDAVALFDIDTDPYAPAYINDLAVPGVFGLAAYGAVKAAVLSELAPETTLTLLTDTAGAIVSGNSTDARDGDDAVALAEGVAFVGSPDGVRSLDASAAGFPELDSLALPGGVSDIALSTDATTLFVATPNGLTVVDATDPASLSAIGNLVVGGGLDRVALSGDDATLFAIAGETLRVIDVDPPATPAVVDSLVFADPLVDLDAAGSRLWVTRETAPDAGVLEEYDASVPSDLDFVAEHGVPGGTPCVSVDGDIAFVGLTDPDWGGSGAKVFDISTPGELSYFQYYSLGNRSASDLCAIDGQLASVGEGGVVLTGTYEPTLPYALGSMPMSGTRVDQLGDLIAVTNPGGGTTFLRYDPVSFRTFGGDRFDTAIAMSQTFDSSEYVVLATGRSYPDALAGVPLAYALNAPILLTEATSIPADVADEIERLGATKAIVLGGTSAMSDAIIAQLRSMGFAAANIERISGATRYETAKAIALRLERVVGDGQIDKVFVATGKNFPDALAAAGAAAKAGCPILLVKPGDANAAALTAISALGATDAVIVGGTAVVPADIASRLPSPERLFGANRYETAVDIADWSMADPDTAFSADNLFVVTGLNFPDALSSGVVAAGSGAPTLLVGEDPSPSTLGFVETHAAEIDAVSIIGGDAAISSEVEHWIAAYAGN